MAYLQDERQIFFNMRDIMWDIEPVMRKFLIKFIQLNLKTDLNTLIDHFEEVLGELWELRAELDVVSNYIDED